MDTIRDSLHIHSLPWMPWIILITTIAIIGLFFQPLPVRADATGSHNVVVLGGVQTYGSTASNIPGVNRVVPPVAGVRFDRITSKELNSRLLANYDTVVLMEICQLDPPLSQAQQNALVSWLKAGGKLLIFDSDRCVPSVDYSWLPAPFTTDNPGAMHDQTGQLGIMVNTLLASGDPASAEYVDVSEYSTDADSGDANVMTTKDPSWNACATATNRNGRTGATIAYAYAERGIMVYNGLDLDDLERENEGMLKLWELAIRLPWNAVSGQPVAGLPAAGEFPVSVASLNVGSTPGPAMISSSGMQGPPSQASSGPTTPPATPQLTLPSLDFGPWAWLVWGIVALIVLLLLAARRNDLVRLIAVFFDLLAAPFVFTTHALREGIANLNERIHETVEGLAYGTEESERRPWDWSGWNLIAPFVYLVWLLILGGSDLYVSVLRFAALLGVEVRLPSLPFDIELLLGVMWVALATLWGFVLFDLYGVTPVVRPWHNFSLAARTRLKQLCWAGFILTAVAAMVFWVWGQTQLGESAPTALTLAMPIVLMGLIAVLLTAAAALAGWAVFISIGGIWAMFLMLLRLVVVILEVCTKMLVELFDLIANLLTKLLDVPAGFGKGLWNWLCQFDFMRRLHLEPMVFIERPVVGKDLVRRPTKAVISEVVSEARAA